MKYRIEKNDAKLNGNIDLPASKSITNRLLIIQALCDEKFRINHISDSDDTRVLLQGLKSKKKKIDIGHAGTAMRFITAYYSTIKTEKTITGSERMRNRPIGILVDALVKLGVEIKYLEKENYPPLLIKGGNIKGGKLVINGSVSSQYITALLLIAPTLDGGLTLTLENKIISSAYIRLTLELMSYFGIEYKWEGDTIRIDKQKYVARNITVEADWSGVSYWYQMVALADEAELSIYGLNDHSLQGDAILTELFKKLGVNTIFSGEKIWLRKQNQLALPNILKFDFINTPDIAQTLAVTCCMLGISFEFKGLETLKIKETNRIKALQDELRKFGYILKEPFEGGLSWNVKDTVAEVDNPVVETYNDHRMAMAFAPIAITRGEVIINDPRVVTKSYPAFWTDLHKTGFIIN